LINEYEVTQKKNLACSIRVVNIFYFRINICVQPNGRFETGKKICLSISGYHPETWQPSWSIRTALLALIGFMPTPGQGTIGSLDYPPEERKKLAKKSTKFACEECCSSGTTITNLLKSREEELAEDNSKGKIARAEEAKQLAMQVSFKVRWYQFAHRPTIRI